MRCPCPERDLRNSPLDVVYSIPYSDVTDLLGGQCAAEFAITDLYEDVMTDSPLGKFHPNYIATRAVRM
ncbi:MAG: hypothetical protein HKUEN02_22110 [Anaerolineaceae bacterium]|nr:MAG: hypothetical protein HKUEN02_22110 [Anaerolineaceae bacterium]